MRTALLWIIELLSAPLLLAHAQAPLQSLVSGVIRPTPRARLSES